MANYDKAYELARDLRESQEYKEYQKAKAEVSSSEEAISILREYRKAEIALQAAIFTGREPDDKQKQDLESITNIVDMHGPIRRYMEAERRILLTLTDIQRILAESMNLLEI